MPILFVYSKYIPNLQAAYPPIFPNCNILYQALLAGKEFTFIQQAKLPIEDVIALLKVFVILLLLPLKL
jgi:hypothetical protein